MYRVWSILPSYALMLMLGVLAALVLANLAPGAHLALIQHPLWFNSLVGPHVADWTAAMGERALGFNPGDATRVMTLRSLVNDGLMALVFVLAAKEVWESLILKGGELRGRRALVPLTATLGGVVVPAAIYLALMSLAGPAALAASAPGWAIPVATEVALAYVIGLWIFGPGHAALRFLLLIAIADDAAGLLIVALFYPQGDLALPWLLLSAGAAVAVWLLCNWLPRRLDRGDQLRRKTTWVRRRLSFWPYALAGALSWYAFARSGLNPALGLLPIIPTLPHSDRPFGIFAEAEAHLRDLLNEVQHGLKYPVLAVLLLFGLVNAGVTPGAAGPQTWAVAAGLILGKPLGIFLFGLLAMRVFGLGLPTGMRPADLAVLGCAAGAGLTVSMFIANAAFPGTALQEAARLGVILSLVSGLTAFALAQLTGTRRK